MHKSTTLLIGLALSLVTLNSNAQTLPKTGAALKASTTKVELKKGESTSLEITRLRSKSFQKAKFGSIKINAPEGLKAVIKIDENNTDLFTVELQSSTDFANGKYTMTIQGEGRNASKVKGTMISLTINGAESLASQN